MTADPRAPIWCRTCAAQNYANATMCWLCRRPMVGASAAPPPATSQIEVIASFGGAILVSLMLVLLFYELVNLYGAVGVLSLAVLGPAVGLLLRLTWPSEAQGGLKTVALVVGVLFGLALASVALLVAAAVLLIAICTGKI